jgi:hypothetical protein
MYFSKLSPIPNSPNLFFLFLRYLISIINYLIVYPSLLIIIITFISILHILQYVTSITLYFFSFK